MSLHRENARLRRRIMANATESDAAASGIAKMAETLVERLAAKERENLHLAREARTWWEAAQTYAAELERHKPLLQAVEWILEDGHMNQEHLARLRAAWEGV